MAKYPQGITSFIPTYQPFQLDWNVLAKNVQLKQTRYDKNWQQLNNVYGALYNADVSNPESQKVKDGLLKQIDFNVKRVTGMDLSLKQNVTQAQQVFKPFYENPNLMADVVRTSEYRKAMSYGKGLATSKNKDERGMYWDGGLNYLGNKMEEFKAMPFNQLSSAGNFEYIPYVNTKDIMQSIAKDMGNMKVMRRHGNYWVTLQNGEILKKPLQNLFQETLRDTPGVQKRFAVEAYNNRKAQVRAVVNSNPDISTEQAERQYLNTQYQDLLKHQTGQYDKIKKEQVSTQKKINSLENQLKNNPNSDTEPTLQKYQETLNMYNNLESAYKDEIDLLESSISKTTGEEDVSSGDLENLRFGVDSSYASALLQKDANSAAEHWSNKNYEETYKADDFAKIDYTNAKSIATHQKKLFLNAASKRGMFPDLYRNKDGSVKYFKDFDEMQQKAYKQAVADQEKLIKKGLKNKKYIETTNDKGEKELIINPLFDKVIALKVNSAKEAGGEEANDKIGWWDLALGYHGDAEKSKAISDENAKLMSQQRSYAKKVVVDNVKTLSQDLTKLFKSTTVTADELNWVLGEDKNNAWQQNYAESIKKDLADGTIDQETANNRMMMMPNPDETTASPGDFYLLSDEEKKATILRKIQSIGKTQNDKTKELSWSDPATLDTNELDLILKRYSFILESNKNLPVFDELAKTSNKLYGLGDAIDDYNYVVKAQVDGSTERANSQIVLLAKHLKERNKNGDWMAPFMFVENADGKHIAGKAEWIHNIVAYAEEIETKGGARVLPSKNLTSEGLAQSTALGAYAGSFFGPGPGTVAGAVLSGGVYTLFKGGQDIYNEIFGSDDGDKFVWGMASTDEKTAWVENLLDMHAGNKQNSLSKQYDDNLDFLHMLDHTEAVPVGLSGIPSFIDSQALMSGEGEFTPTTNAIVINTAWPESSNYSQYLQQYRPILQNLKLTRTDGGDLNNVSVKGLNILDLEETQNEYDGEKIEALTELILKDASTFGLNTESDMKQLTIGISPMSRNTLSKSSIILIPDEDYLDGKLKIVYPNTDDKEKREQLKVDILNESQGLSIDLNSSLVENTTLYSNYFENASQIRLLEEGFVSYPYRGDKRFSISFKAEGKDPGSAMKVYHTYPLYLPNQGKEVIRVNEVTSSIVSSRNLQKLRENFYQTVSDIKAKNQEAFQSAKKN